MTHARAEGVAADDFVLLNPKYRHPKANLRSQCERLAKAAGVKPWGEGVSEHACVTGNGTDRADRNR